jgi:hypothetical protein
MRIDLKSLFCITSLLTSTDIRLVLSTLSISLKLFTELFLLTASLELFKSDIMYSVK